MVLRGEGLALEQPGQGLKVNGLAWRYEANLSIAQSTARHYLSVGDIFFRQSSPISGLHMLGFVNHLLNLCGDCSCSCFAGVRM